MATVRRSRGLSSCRGFPRDRSGQLDIRGSVSFDLGQSRPRQNLRCLAERFEHNYLATVTQPNYLWASTIAQQTRSSPASTRKKRDQARRMQGTNTVKAMRRRTVEAVLAGSRQIVQAVQYYLRVEWADRTN